ncbi:uncharacterized protein LOC125951564 [Anopheles darlingi]|uniref:uncharacterized protein LOC125951564 n=1 Tax=Anopheles darlingi TaxID=43151 RepID=UPI0021005A27|nr:uncharacterized protein LOC125951564 [Anopheles darlingi]
MRTIYLFCCILAIIAGTFGKRYTGNRRGSSRATCNWLNERLEILYPRGLRIAQPKSSSLVSFGIEVYLNREQQQQQQQVGHDAMVPCDVCVNSTVATSDATTIELFHPTAIIRAKDHFQYAITNYYRDGVVRQYRCSFYVAQDRLRYETPIAPSSCRTSIARTTDLGKPSQNDKMLLEEILNESIGQCIEQTNMLVMADSNTVRTRAQMEQYVRSRLNALVPGLDWGNGFKLIYKSEEGLVFELESLIAKKKLLRLVQSIERAKDIQDYDSVPPSYHDIREYDIA